MESVKQKPNIDEVNQDFVNKKVELDDLRTKEFKDFIAVLSCVYPSEYRFRNIPWVSISSARKTFNLLLLDEEDFDFTWKEVYDAIKDYVDSFEGDYKFLKRLQFYVYEYKDGIGDSVLLSDLMQRRIGGGITKRARRIRKGVSEWV